MVNVDKLYFVCVYCILRKLCCLSIGVDRRSFTHFFPKRSCLHCGEIRVKRCYLGGRWRGEGGFCITLVIEMSHDGERRRNVSSTINSQGRYGEK